MVHNIYKLKFQSSGYPATTDSLVTGVFWPLETAIHDLKHTTLNKFHSMTNLQIDF